MTPSQKSDEEEFIDGNMQIFQINDADGNEVAEAVEGMYPQMDHESFDSVDVTFDGDGGREPPCNLEWVECFDEVLSALNTLPVDLPGLQVRNRKSV